MRMAKGAEYRSIWEVRQLRRLRGLAPGFRPAPERRGGVGDDGGCVRFHAPHLGSGLRRKDEGGSEMTGVTCDSVPRTWVPACAGKTEEGPEMTGVSCGSTPRTWVPAFAGMTEEGPEMTGDDGGYVRFRAPHLGSGLRRKDGGGSEMTGVACDSVPRTWVPAFAGKTEEGPEMTGVDGGYVRFRAPHLGSGLRRKDGGEVGDDGGVVRFHAPHLGSCLRRKDGGGGRR